MQNRTSGADGPRLSLEGFDGLDPAQAYELLDAFAGSRNPFPLDLFRLWREAGPVVEGDGPNFAGGYVVPPLFLGLEGRTFMTTTYAAMREVAMNPERFSTGASMEMGERTLVNMDGEPHRRFRALLSKGLSPKSVKIWEERMIAPMVNRIIDGFIQEGKVEVRRQLAQGIPARAIGAVLGLHPDDLHAFNTLGLLQLMQAADPLGARAVARLRGYFDELVAHRRSLPPEELRGREDIVSLLVKAREGSDQLSDGEISSVLHFLLIAGTDTTHRSLASAVYFLVVVPGLYGTVLADRSLVPALVEETLRLAPPAVIMARRVVRDTEVGEVPLPGGATILLNFASANRDPAAWDEPDEFRLGRMQQHVAFSAGPHVCAGMHLARLEMRIALNLFLDRCPNLRLDPDASEPVITGSAFTAPDEMHVRFEPGPKLEC